MPPNPHDARARPQLSRRHYFHGTKASLKRGDVVVPRNLHGGPPTNAPLTAGGERLPESDEYAYVTTDYYFAWAYAYASGETGEPVVLVVEPRGFIESDPEQSEHMNAYRCHSALVLAVDRKAAFSAEAAEKGWKTATDNPSASLKGFVVRRP
jgi:hypothetical protein